MTVPAAAQTVSPERKAIPSVDFKLRRTVFRCALIYNGEVCFMFLKKSLFIMVLVLSLSMLFGCAKFEIPENLPELADKIPSRTPEGFDYLGGSWEVGAIYYEGHLIDIHDNEAIEDLYDTIFLTFLDDGTFSYFDIFFSEGSYEKHGDAFLLKETRSYRLVIEGDEFYEKEFESDSNMIYILEPLDENTLSLSEYDPVMDAPAVNDEPYIFVRNGTESSYISKNKTPV